MGAKSRRILAIALLSVAAVSASAIPAQSAVPEIPVLSGVRTGAHSNFDRIVLDLSGPRPRVSSGFVNTVTQDGSGNVVWLPGTAFGEVHAAPVRAHDDAGHPSYPGPRKFRTPDLANVTAFAITGDFEGVLSVGVGMRRQSWLRAFTLTGPTRVVIDVGR